MKGRIYFESSVPGNENHYHSVIWIDVEKVKDWSDEEVARRWLQVFTGPLRKSSAKKFMVLWLSLETEPQASSRYM